MAVSIGLARVFGLVYILGGLLALAIIVAVVELCIRSRLEAKKSGLDDADDRAKLGAFMGNDFQYEFGVLLRFVTEGEGDVLWEYI